MHGEESRAGYEAETFFGPAAPAPPKGEREPLVAVQVHRYGASAPASAPAYSNGCQRNGRAAHTPFRKALDAPAGTATNWLGVLLAFLSGAFFTLSSAAVKALRAMDPMELLLVRGVLQVAVMLAAALWRGAPLLGNKGFRLLLQLQVPPLIPFYLEFAWARGRADAGAAVLLVPAAAARRRHHHHLQLARGGDGAVVRVPQGALRLLPHAHRVHAGHGRRAHRQAALHLPRGRAALRRGGVRVRGGGDGVHGAQHGGDAQVQGRALLGGGAAPVAVDGGAGAGAAADGGPPPPQPVGAAAPHAARLGHGRRRQRARPLGAGAGGVRAGPRGRGQGGGDALAGHRAGLRAAGVRLRGGARLGERDGRRARAALRAGHGAGEPGAHARQPPALAAHVFLFASPSL